MHWGHEVCWFIIQIEHTCEFFMCLVAHSIFLHTYLYQIHTRVQFKYCSYVIVIWYWHGYKTPLRYWLVVYQLNLILPWINFGDSMNILHQFTSCDWFSNNHHRFYYPLIYFGLLSVSIVSVPLNQQTRGMLALEIVPNLLDGTKNYHSVLQFSQNKNKPRHKIFYTKYSTIVIQN